MLVAKILLGWLLASILFVPAWMWFANRNIIPTSPEDEMAAIRRMERERDVDLGL